MRPKYAILAFAFITSVVTGVLLSPTTASAVSAYDNTIHNSSELPLNYAFISSCTGDFTENALFSTNWATELMLNEDLYTFSGISSSDYEFVHDIWNGDTRYWSASLRNLYGGESTHIIIQITDDPLASVDFTGTSPDTEAYFTAHSGTNYAYMTIEVVNQIGTNCNAKITNFGKSTNGGTYYPIATEDSTYQPYIVYTDIVNYPSEYEGEEIQSGIDQIDNSQSPQFGYNITDEGTLRAQYLQNITNFPPHYLDWQLLESDASWAEGTEVQSVNNKDPKQIFQVDDLTPNFYLLKVWLDYTAPSLPPSEDDVYPQSVTFKIDYSLGKFIIGSSQLNDCTEDGVCIAGVENCSIYGDVFQKMNCEMQKQINIGVINPSITAFKGLFTALIVSNDPDCSFTLSNISIDGQTLSFSSLGTQICSSTNTLHENFPIISVLVNFFLAISLFYLIARIINKFTDKNQNELVGGI